MGWSWSRSLGSQPAGDSHKPGGRLTLLSTRPTVTFPAREHHHPLTGTKLYCLVAKTHDCVREQLAQSRYQARIEPGTSVGHATVYPVTPPIPRLHARSSSHQANIEQTSSKYEACIKHSLHEANIKQTSSNYSTRRARVFWMHLLDVCSMIARCLLDRVNGVQATFFCKNSLNKRLNIKTLTRVLRVQGSSVAAWPGNADSTGARQVESWRFHSRHLHR